MIVNQPIKHPKVGEVIKVIDPGRFGRFAAHLNTLNWNEHTQTRTPKVEHTLSEASETVPENKIIPENPDESPSSHTAGSSHDIRESDLKFEHWNQSVIYTPLHANQADPETLTLIDWFCGNRDSLPREPYRLTPWIFVINPEKYYESLAMDITGYPSGPRAHVIGGDLRRLKEYLEKSNINDDMK